LRIDLATDDDFPDFLALGGQVEELFGPMVAEHGFHHAVRRNISRGSAIVARDGSTVNGGLFFAHHRHPRYSVGWLVVDDSHRSLGIGQALLAWAFSHLVEVPAVWTS
jgi:hypothetical protein